MKDIMKMIILFLIMMIIFFVNSNSLMTTKRILKSSSLMMISKDTLDNMSNEISKSINTKYKASWIGGGGGGNNWATTGNLYIITSLSHH